jgi:hypothetical protein
VYSFVSLASDCDLLMFRNLLSVPSSKALHKVFYTQPLKMEMTEGSKTSANHNLTPEKYPKEYTEQGRMKLESHVLVEYYMNRR